MKLLRLNDQEYVLGEDFTWSGPDGPLVEILDSDTRILLEFYSPGHGDPRAYVFYTLARRYGLEPRDDERLVAPPPGGVF